MQVGKHPNADALYLEEIDVGEEKPRQVSRSLSCAVRLTDLSNCADSPGLPHRLPINGDSLCG